MREHGPAMYAAMCRCLRDAGHAEDALQEALVSVYRHAGQFAGASRLSTRLHRIAVNTALMQRRSRARRPWTLLDGATLEAAGAELPRAVAAWAEGPGGAAPRRRAGGNGGEAGP